MNQKTAFITVSFAFLSTVSSFFFFEYFHRFSVAFTSTSEDIITAMPRVLTLFYFSIFFILLSIFFIGKSIKQKNWVSSIISLGLLGYVAYDYVMFFHESWMLQYLAILLGVYYIFYDKKMYIP